VSDELQSAMAATPWLLVEVVFEDFFYKVATGSYVVMYPQNYSVIQMMVQIFSPMLQKHFSNVGLA
jgi:hypothetical protein